MADITNPQAVKFCNERIRPLADAYAKFYFLAKNASAAYAAQGIGSLIPNTADVVIDGSAQDGRATITGAKVNGFVTQIGSFIMDLEASSNAKLNVLLQIAVNTNP